MSSVFSSSGSAIAEDSGMHFNPSVDDASEPISEDSLVYRALSKGAVGSLILAVLSLAAYAAAGLLVLPFAGTLLGVNALRNIRRYPDELSGKSLAILGSLGCFVILVSAAALHSYVYATEVPPGCLRISFADLQPTPDHPELPVPPAAQDLDGKKVFVKGYVYPDGQQYNIKQFVLVPDMGTCCFGGQPKLTDMIEVNLTDKNRVEYSRRKRKLAGVMKVDTQLKPVTGVGGVYYQLEADYVK